MRRFLVGAIVIIIITIVYVMRLGADIFGLYCISYIATVVALLLLYVVSCAPGGRNSGRE